LLNLQIQDLFDSILTILLLAHPESGSQVSQRTRFREDDFGVLEARITYANGYHLTARLGVSVESGNPEWEYYSFHFQKASGDLVFRYDNSRHYPDLSSFPHHKHLGPEGEVEASAQPTVHQIAREIAEHLARQ